MTQFDLFIMLLFLFFNSFSLVNFFNDRKYLLNMNISHSYEFSGNDTVLYVLFKDSLVPKGVCEWSMDYNIKGANVMSIHFFIGILILLTTRTMRSSLKGAFNQLNF